MLLLYIAGVRRERRQDSEALRKLILNIKEAKGIYHEFFLAFLFLVVCLLKYMTSAG